MIILFEDKKDCCGCTACKHVCPTNTIKMIPDDEGFLYPIIDTNKCIECGLCKKVCIFQNGYDASGNLENPIIYAVKNKDFDVRMRSRSGGVFVSVANSIIDKNGVVYGVGYEGKFVVSHKKAETKDEIREFQGSKYVQSNLNQVYVDVKTNLLEGRYILFSGTPCQVAGLYGFLGNNINIDKLIAIDLVCHGVPSPLMWKEYLNFCENKYNGKVNKVDFRDKEYGWNTHFETLVVDDKKYKSKIYSNLFNLGSMMRPSCHNCKYTNFNRSSDITIADFWGIDKSMPDFNDNKGVSLVLVNRLKGKDVFEEIKDELVYRGSKKENCLQPQLQYPSKPFQGRKQFWKDYDLNGFEYIVKKYGIPNLKTRIKGKMILALKKLGLFDLIYKVVKS